MYYDKYNVQCTRCPGRPATCKLKYQYACRYPISSESLSGWQDGSVTTTWQNMSIKPNRPKIKTYGQL